MKKTFLHFPEKVTSLFRYLVSGSGSRVGDVILILFLGLSISLLISLFLDRLPKNLVVGEVAQQDIRADQNYEIVDDKSTAKLRQDAMESVLPVYDFDPSIAQDTFSHLHEAFENGRHFLAVHSPLNGGHFDALTDSEESELKNQFTQKLETVFPDEQYQLMRHFRFHPIIERVLASLLQGFLESPTIHALEDVETLEQQGFVLRKMSPDENFPEDIIHSTSRLQDLDGVRKKITDTSPEAMAIRFNLDLIGREAFVTLKQIALNFVKINTNYDGLESDSRKEKAGNNIKDVTIKIQAGESIIRSGDRFEPWHITVIGGMLKERLKTNRLLKLVGLFLFVNLVLLIIYTFASKYIRKFHPNRRDLVFLSLNLIVFLVVLRMGSFFGNSIRDPLRYYGLDINSATLYYAIPIAAGAMLVRFILNSETAFVFAVILSLFSGVFLDNSLDMTIYYLISGIFAAHSIAHVERRSMLLLAGVKTGLVNAAAILSLNLISTLSVTTGKFHFSQAALNMGSGFVGGILTSMTVLVFSPMMEIIFNYTTDIKLLELANLSHPLLKEMIVRAPGTYHHSQIVGILAEAGAQAIGANPLLARVASYYHDIGKMKKPQYFIENQRGGENPHDKLVPSMSALIIEAHVKDGIEMAKMHKLPQRIADMIPQHQGTKLIGFFFNKAKKMADPALGTIDERDYRYTGPKPQTREAGIIMLADTLEAAARSLPEKTPGKIQQIVEKLINQHFVDQQLDDCELTLKDLHRMGEAFVKILIGIYHQRVEYPEGALDAQESAEIHYLKNKSATAYASASEQRTSSLSNIAPLFRKKNPEDPSSSGAG